MLLPRLRLSTFFILFSTLSLVAAPTIPRTVAPAVGTPTKTAPATSPVLDVKGINDQLIAAKRTKSFLTQLGYKAKFPSEDPTDGIWITDEGIGFTIRVFVDDTGLDRFVISCAVPGKGPETLGKLECMQALNDLNFNVNVCSFSLTPDGDLAFSVNLGFSDTLDARVFREEIVHIKSFTSYFMTTDKPYMARPRDLLVK